MLSHFMSMYHYKESMWLSHHAHEFVNCIQLMTIEPNQTVMLYACSGITFKIVLKHHMQVSTCIPSRSIKGYNCQINTFYHNSACEGAVLNSNLKSLDATSMHCQPIRFQNCQKLHLQQTYLWNWNSNVREITLKYFSIHGLIIMRCDDN